MALSVLLSRRLAKSILNVCTKTQQGNNHAISEVPLRAVFGSESDPLENAVRWAVMDNEPDTLSAQRAISHIYTDLGMWFYRGAKEQPVAARNFLEEKLKIRKGDNAADSILHQWQSDSARGDLRRHAVWMICGRDVPDADPVSKPARYLDPIDYVSWVMGIGRSLEKGASLTENYPSKVQPDQEEPSSEPTTTGEQTTKVDSSIILVSFAIRVDFWSSLVPFFESDC